jgi:hypothetical protein
VIGIVSTSRAIRCRQAILRAGGQFADIAEMERGGETHDAEVIDRLFSNKNELHNNYQDFQAFLDHGGRIGLQHDPLLYGAYLLNPFLVRVEKVPMLVVEQGQVAVIKAYVGLAPSDTSGTEFPFGTLVRPGIGHLAGAAAHGQVSDQPILLQGRIGADGDSDAELGGPGFGGAPSGRQAQLTALWPRAREGFAFKMAFAGADPYSGTPGRRG